MKPHGNLARWQVTRCLANAEAKFESVKELLADEREDRITTLDIQIVQERLHQAIRELLEASEQNLRLFAFVSAEKRRKDA